MIKGVERFYSSEMEPQLRQKRESEILREVPVTLRRILLESSNDFSELSPIELVEYGVHHISETIKIHRQGYKPDQQSSKSNLYQLFEDALTLTGNQLSRRGIQVKKEMVLQQASYRFPRNQMLQALINLMVNASEAVFEQFPSREGGVIRVRMENIVEDGYPFIMITVADNGIGFSADERCKILDFGFSTKMRGSGFGLYATDNFLQTLGGGVRIDSEGVGKGATVSLVFPALN